MSIANQLKTITANIPKVFEAGKNVNDGIPHHFEYAPTLASMFDGAIFPDNYEMTLIIPQVKSLRYAFRNTTGLKKVILKGENSNIVNFGYAFQSNVEEVDLTEFTAKPDDLTYAFSNTTLKKIVGDLDFSEITNTGNAFRNCSSLEEVRIKANTIKLSVQFGYSPNLSAQSVQSIVDGLATVETAQTLTLHSAVAVSDTQKATIQSKGWTLVQ